MIMWFIFSESLYLSVADFFEKNRHLNYTFLRVEQVYS